MEIDVAPVAVVPGPRTGGAATARGVELRRQGGTSRMSRLWERRRQRAAWGVMALAAALGVTSCQNATSQPAEPKTPAASAAASPSPTTPAAEVFVSPKPGST